MAQIHPFSAIHYNVKSIPNLSDVIIPPYDVITPDEKEAYLKKSPYNFSHIILPQSANEDYSRAAALLTHWKKDHILLEEPHPYYFLYQQDFEAAGKIHSRRTLMATVTLSDFSEGNIRPHENVHEKYRSDRLQILRKTEHQLSHVFGMVKDPNGTLDMIYEKVMFSEPMIHATTNDKVTHTLWRVDSKYNSQLESYFSDKPIYIVDGHHRYSSNLMHAKEIGAYGNPKNPAGQMLFAISNAYDPALVVFPTHRLVKNRNISQLADDFILTPVTWDTLIAFTHEKQSTPTFGLCDQGKTFLAEPKEWQKATKTNGSLALLSVWWSDEKILKEKAGIQEQERSKVVTYVRTAEEMKPLVGNTDMAFLHPLPQTEIVMKIADENLFMPQKSTYFYPKLAAGITFRSLK